MGRALLIVCVAALLGACAPDEPEPVPLATADSTAPAVDGHRSLTCAACHRGDLADGHRASVPGAACTESGCHAQGGPTLVSTATATFPHRDHGSDRDIALSCAGCHTHREGREPLTVSVDGCALCHMTNQTGGKGPGDCRLCHVQPKHVAQTSQALAIPHSSLPWVENGCVRCHYDVAEPAVRVQMTRCNGCHARDSTIVARGVGTDLHPGHVAINCVSCHEGEAHHVRAMSSAVNLVCADCHTRSHDVDPATYSPAACSDCHQQVHQPQQRLLLGLLPDETSGPSGKFMAGLTCRSCHQRGTVATAGRGNSEACAGCHPPAYSKVLDWWLEGTRKRTALVTSYIARAETELGDVRTDTVHALLRAAHESVELVREAGGQHNLELSDRIFRASVDRVTAAYLTAGRAAPAPPALGNVAHQGTCSFCHYAPTESLDFRRMSGPFHRSVLQLDR
jgi:hypothetical protein